MSRIIEKRDVQGQLIAYLTDIADSDAEKRFVEAYSDWLRSLREKSFIEVRL
ncbi:MAG: hypothetical protein P8Y77_07710 [Nitrospirota bacterium]